MAYIINPYRFAAAAGTDTEIAYDTTTIGNWSGVYGNLGYYVPSHGAINTTLSSFPAQITSTSISGGQNWWQSSYDSESQALQTPGNTSQKRGGLRFFSGGATGHYQWTSSIDLKVAVYVTKQPTARNLSVSLRDSSNNALSTTRVIFQNLISNGVWVVYSVKSGTRRIAFTSTAGDNPNWSAIFFSTL